MVSSSDQNFNSPTLPSRKGRRFRTATIGLFALISLLLLAVALFPGFASTQADKLHIAILETLARIPNRRAVETAQQAAVRFEREQGAMMQRRLSEFLSSDTIDPGASLAKQLVVTSTSKLTAEEANKRMAACLRRQWLEAYRQYGRHDQPWDADALRLIQFWVTGNREGEAATNHTILQDLGTKIVGQGCDDPVVLTVCAVTCNLGYERINRLGRSVQQFRNSSYKAFPKLYASVILTSSQNLPGNQIAAADASALPYLKELFRDGSIQADEQAEIADMLLVGWGSAFMKRNATNVSLAVESGAPLEWLELMINGYGEIQKGWELRGPGYANTVTAEGAEGFARHLAEARHYLTRAWRLRADLPLAAATMIAVAV